MTTTKRPTMKKPSQSGWGYGASVKVSNAFWRGRGMAGEADLLSGGTLVYKIGARASLLARYAGATGVLGADGTCPQSVSPQHGPFRAAQYSCHPPEGAEMNQRFPMTLKLIDPDIYDPSIMDGFPVTEAAIELSAENCQFLAGLIKRYRPSTLLEVGVSAGGSSALLLHALDKLGLESELVSVDLLERWNKDAGFATGWAAAKLYPDRKNWQLHTGSFLPEIIETLNMEFDFCFLDTVHRLPGELLDYLVVLPFMREGGIIAMHDTAMYYWIENQVATRVLYDACVGKKIIPPQLTKSDANLSAFQITDETYRHVENIFSALCMPWGQIIAPKQFHIYHEFFKKYYGEEAADWFARVWEWNNRHLIDTTMRGRLPRQRAAHPAGE